QAPHGADTRAAEDGEQGTLPAAEGADRADEFHDAETHRLLPEERFSDQRDPEDESRADEHADDRGEAAVDGVDEEESAVLSVQRGHEAGKQHAEGGKSEGENVGDLEVIEVDERGGDEGAQEDGAAECDDG